MPSKENDPPPVGRQSGGKRYGPWPWLLLQRGGFPSIAYRLTCTCPAQACEECPGPAWLRCTRDSTWFAFVRVSFWWLYHLCSSPHRWHGAVGLVMVNSGGMWVIVPSCRLREMERMRALDLTGHCSGFIMIHAHGLLSGVIQLVPPVPSVAPDMV